MVKEMARRIRESGGGAALIADYGQDGVRKNTLRVSYHFVDYFWISIFFLLISKPFRGNTNVVAVGTCSTDEHGSNILGLDLTLHAVQYMYLGA